MSLVCRGKQHRLPHARGDFARVNVAPNRLIRTCAASRTLSSGSPGAVSTIRACAAQWPSALSASVRPARKSCIGTHHGWQLPASRHSLGPLTLYVQTRFETRSVPSVFRRIAGAATSAKVRTVSWSPATSLREDTAPGATTAGGRHAPPLSFFTIWESPSLIEPSRNGATSRGVATGAA